MWKSELEFFYLWKLQALYQLMKKQIKRKKIVNYYPAKSFNWFQISFCSSEFSATVGDGLSGFWATGLSELPAAEG